MAKRTSYAASLKAKVALEVLRGERTVSELQPSMRSIPQSGSPWLADC